MLQALKFFLVFTRHINGVRKGCQSWACASEASSCCTIDYKTVQIPYKNICTLFIYPLFTTNSFLTTNKHNVKIFALAFSSPCWHLPIGTGHGKQFLKWKVWGVNGRVIAIIRKSFRKPFICLIRTL